MTFVVAAVSGVGMAGCSGGGDGSPGASTLAIEPVSASDAAATVTDGAPESGAGSEVSESTEAPVDFGDVTEATFVVDDVTYRIAIPTAWDEGDGWQVGPPEGPDASQVWARVESGYTSVAEYAENYVPPGWQTIANEGVTESASGAEMAYVELEGIQPNAEVEARSYVAFFMVDTRALIIAFESTQAGWEKYADQVVDSITSVEILS